MNNLERLGCVSAFIVWLGTRRIKSLCVDFTSPEFTLDYWMNKGAYENVKLINIS